MFSSLVFVPEGSSSNTLSFSYNGNSDPLPAYDVAGDTHADISVQVWKDEEDISANSSLEGGKIHDKKEASETAFIAGKSSRTHSFVFNRCCRK